MKDKRFHDNFLYLNTYISVYGKVLRSAEQSTEHTMLFQFTFAISLYAKGPNEKN